MIIRNIGILILMACLQVGYSQDVHFSQFFNSPLHLNPALTGIHNGDGRIHANYKNQWASVPVDYTSADIGIDLKHRFNDKRGFLGYGVLLNYDTAGDLNLGWTGANAFLSYAVPIGNHGLLSPGVSVGFQQRALDPSDALTGNQWDGKTIAPGAGPEGITSDAVSFIDVGVGLNFRRQTTYRKFFDIGASLAHLNGPSEKFFTNAIYEVKRPQRFSLYGMLNHQIHDNVDVLLNALYSTQTEYEEILINAQAKIYLGGTKDKALYLGAGYRLDDAYYPMIGLELGQFFGAVSYDINVSGFDEVTTARGGPELSLRYIWSRVPDQLYQPCLIY